MGEPDSPGAKRTVRTGGGLTFVLGLLQPSERQVLFEMFAGVVHRGEGFPQAPPLTDSDFEAAWGAGATVVVAARHDDALAGAYYLKPNYPGRAGHICNAGYVVDPDWRRRGLGRLLVEDSLDEAGRRGFDAMQFNLVFASNPARRLYEELGFQVTGRVPGAVAGEEALVYWRAVPVSPDAR